MASASGGTAPRVNSVFDHFRAAPFEFDFFQAVRLLERAVKDRGPVGHDQVPAEEIVRFRSHLSIAFPPSPIVAFDPPDEFRPVPLMTVAFLGLYGPSGTLPTHYTQLMIDLVRDVRGPERRSLRDWFDIFNHRIISLFYRAWEKYRFPISYERAYGPTAKPGTIEPFTDSVRGIMGLSGSALSNRLRVVEPVPAQGFELASERKLAGIDDLALLYYAGLFAQRPRNAANLKLIVQDYFELPTDIVQFVGQWLPISSENQTVLGVSGCLGINAVAGARVWDRASRFRVILGPMTYERFEEFLPDKTPVARRKSFFLLNQLVRLFAGMEFDFDIQLLLRADEVPEAQLGESAGAGPRLGWNVWLTSGPFPKPADDALFESEWVSRVE